MFTQRLQVLISAEQRRRLEAEADRRAVSVASLIREAVDAKFGGVSRDERLRAVAAIKANRGGRYLSPEELSRIADEERDALLDP
jgi:hypothetical protein